MYLILLSFFLILGVSFAESFDAIASVIELIYRGANDDSEEVWAGENSSREDREVFFSEQKFCKFHIILEVVEVLWFDAKHHVHGARRFYDRETRDMLKAIAHEISVFLKCCSKLLVV